MNQHVTSWLEAYHDGELHGMRLRQVEAHLAECAACRTELEQLQALSALLQESPAAARRTSPDRFVAQVKLRLARRPEQTVGKRALETGWRLIPVGLLGTWAFAQTVFVIVGIVFIASNMSGDTAASLLPVPGGSWLLEAFRWTGMHLDRVERMVLQWLSTLGGLALLNLTLLIVFALLYWSWLASWWVRQRQSSVVDRAA